MKTIRTTLLVLTSAFLLCGCKHYDYYLVQPGQFTQKIGNAPVTIHYAPMDYTLVRHKDRLYMDVANPNDAAISLVGERSYVVDPYNRSHPIRGAVIAPHSFIPMTLPTPPLVYQVYAPYPYPYDFYGPGPGWGWGWGGPWRHGPFFDPWFYGPPPPMSYSVSVPTPYTWPWPSGQVNLHLGYQQASNTFEHHFVFDKREAKK